MTIQQYMAMRDEFIRLRGLARHKLGPDIPILNEDHDQGFDKQYVYHTAWAMKKLYDIEWSQDAPEIHVDIGSSLYFVGMLAAVMKVKHYDFRPPDLELPNLIVEAADITHLPFEDGSIPSLSCMHVVEHIGLGRYGDPIDPEGDLKAMAELKRVLAPGGSLLFVVPVGEEPVVHFNAHRIFTADQILEIFQPTMECVDFQNFFGAGCFHFKKVPS